MNSSKRACSSLGRSILSVAFLSPFLLCALGNNGRFNAPVIFCSVERCDNGCILWSLFQIGLCPADRAGLEIYGAVLKSILSKDSKLCKFLCDTPLKLDAGIDMVSIVLGRRDMDGRAKRLIFPAWVQLRMLLLKNKWWHAWIRVEALIWLWNRAGIQL